MSAGRTTLYGTTKGYLKNNAVELMKVGGLGPVIAIAMQDVTEPDKLGRADAIVAAWKIDPTTGLAGRAMQSTTATAITLEATGYVGNGTDRAFSGQVLDHLPIVPRSVTLTPASGTVLQDGGDGIFYTVDADKQAAGTIDYFTGAMTLAYPVGKAPGVGAINAAYLYEAEVLKPYGRKAYTWPSLSPQDVMVIGGACKGTDIDSKACGSTLVHTDIIVAGDAQSLGGL